MVSGVGIGCLLGIVLSIGGPAIHFYTVWYAFHYGGLLAAIVTMLLPGISEVYWLFPIAKSAGSWWNYYSAALLVWLCACIMLSAVKSKDEE